MTVHEPVITEFPALQFISIRRTCKITDMGPVLGEVYGKLSEYMGRNQLEFVGPPVSFYYMFNDVETEFEAGLPVARPVANFGEIEYKELPPQRVAFVDFYGNYDFLMAGWDVLMSFVDQNGLEKVGPPFEVYYTDPEEVQDPEQWRTGIYCPIA